MTKLCEIAVLINNVQSEIARANFESATFRQREKKLIPRDPSGALISFDGEEFRLTPLFNHLAVCEHCEVREDLKPSVYDLVLLGLQDPSVLLAERIHSIRRKL